MTFDPNAITRRSKRVPAPGGDDLTVESKGAIESVSQASDGQLHDCFAAPATPPLPTALAERMEREGRLEPSIDPSTEVPSSHDNDGSTEEPVDEVPSEFTRRKFPPWVAGESSPPSYLGSG